MLGSQFEPDSLSADSRREAQCVSAVIVTWRFGNYPWISQSPFTIAPTFFLGMSSMD